MLDRSARQSPSAARMSRMRRRARLGLKVFPVEVDAWVVVAALLDRKILNETQALDDALVAKAIAEIVSRWAAGNRSEI
jgi:hypothetical protein